MKKRKTYEISVIDKTYSKTISDETKFYTSDTSLELVFKLKETEYTFESAEIVLLNINDKSLITRRVIKGDEGFVYTFEKDIISHYGDWRGQLRFEQSGEIYVSSPVKFRIENDLSNDRPPQLSDVQSWISLKRYADSLTEELKQAVLSIDSIDDTFNENETVRQSQFSNAEQSRQDTFETSESDRNETFNTNEDVRQTQELEREKAETTRQQAESSRVSAEEQRKIDHANRSAELAGKADKVVLKNEIENGDFSDGTTGWNSTQSNISVANNGNLKVEFNVDYSYAQAWRYVDLAPRSKYYFRTKFELGNLNTYASVIDWFRGGVTSSKGVYEIVKENTYEEIIRRQLKFSKTSALGDYYYINNVQLINLTQTFGTGNEPTKEEMSEIIKVTGYIDDEYALNNKEMLIWTLALIRRNKNAIITLGGTI